MPDPVYSLAIEFVTGSFTNVTSDCLHLSFTRNLATNDSGLSIGTCDFILQNEERKYSPTNSASPYSPNVVPNKRIQVQATYSGSTYPLFTGYIDNFGINPVIGNRTVHIQTSDRVKQIDNSEVDLPFQINYNVGSLFTDILSCSGVASADRAVDSIPDKVTFAWFNDRKGSGALNELLTYGNYKLYVGGDGKVNIFNRSHNWESIAVASLNEFLDLSYSLNIEDISNVIRVEGTPRKLSTNISTVAFLGTVETIPASGYSSFWLTYADPINNERPTPANSVIFPVANVDYTITTQPEGGTDLTTTTSVNGILFGTTAVFSLFNGSGVIAYVNQFQLRGYPLQRQPTVAYQKAVSSSQALYGKLLYTINSDLIDDLQFAKDYVNMLMTKKKDLTGKTSFSLKNQWPSQLFLELGTLVSIVESQTTISSVFLVTGITHNIETSRGLEHTTDYQLELWREGYPLLLLDSSSYGKLDDGRQLAF